MASVDGHSAGQAEAEDTGRLTQLVNEGKEELREIAKEDVSVRGRHASKGDIFKFVGLIVFFVVIIGAVALLWPYLSGLFEEGGIQATIEGVQDSGVVGVLLLLALQFLQVVVAFIPGEVVQLAAGALYGPWFGALIILVGCIVSSAFIFQVVHKLGAPFVQDMVSTKYLDKLKAFEESGKLDTTVFVLFLIPGLPKDVFTYLVPLTDMRMGKFLILANIARIPGIVVSTYAANGLVEGNYLSSIILFVAVAALALLGFFQRDNIMAFVDKHFPSKKAA